MSSNKTRNRVNNKEVYSWQSSIQKSSGPSHGRDKASRLFKQRKEEWKEISSEQSSQKAKQKDVEMDQRCTQFFKTSSELTSNARVDWCTTYAYYQNFRNEMPSGENTIVLKAEIWAELAKDCLQRLVRLSPAIRCRNSTSNHEVSTFLLFSWCFAPKGLSSVLPLLLL